MADTSSIEWTDATWNVITGCTLVSEGCRHCYAATLATTRLRNHPSRAGLARVNATGEAKWTGEVRWNEAWATQPLQWAKPRRIFVVAHGDLFHESVPDEWIDKVFAVMALSPRHTFQVLTKRAARMRAYLSRCDDHGRHPSMAYAALLAATGRWNTPALDLRVWPLPNVQVGVSVEDQPAANERLPELLAAPAAVHFVSMEPLLGPVDLGHVTLPSCGGRLWIDALRPWWRTPDESVRLDWIIVGGESGRHARPMHPDWARSLRDQAEAAGVPFVFKQWGEWISVGQIDGALEVEAAPASPGRWAHPHRSRVLGGALDGQCFESLPEHHDILRVGKRTAGRLLDGREWNGAPGLPRAPATCPKCQGECDAEGGCRYD